MNFDELKKDNFFIIDSNNIGEVESKLYGYAIIDSKIYYDMPKEESLDGTGSYVYINNDSDRGNIRICQDLNGNYGLYLFKQEDYFAISNSFVMLVEYLFDKFELSLNYDYSKSYMSAEICSYIFEETLVNEITVLPRNAIFCIDKHSREISLEEIDYEENSVKVNSKRGIEILDSWFFKWMKIIQSVKSETNNITVDLTGGLDSRTIFSLILSSNIDLNELTINSSKADMYKEDFEIASSMADYFQFILNQPSNIKYKQIPDLETYFNISFYSKIGFSKALWPVNKYPAERAYNFVGYGGECIRNYIPSTVDENILFKVNLAKKYSEEWALSTKRYLGDNYKRLGEKIRNENISPVNSNYKETRARYHFGKSVVERFLINQINLAPLIDPLLYKLDYIDEACDDDNLVLALIYDRYCKELLDFKIEGGRKISDDAMRYIKEINETYPLDINRLNEIKRNASVAIAEENVDVGAEENKINPNHLIKESHEFFDDIFKSDAFRNHFEMYFSKEAYDRIVLDLDKVYIGAMCDIFSTIGVFYIINLVEASKRTNHENITSWLNNFLTIPTYNESKDDYIRLEKELENKDKIIEELSAEVDRLSSKVRAVEELSGDVDRLSSKVRAVEELSGEVKRLSDELKQKQNILDEIEGSNSWKITKPLRKSRNIFKK